MQTTARVLKKLGMRVHPDKTFSGNTQQRFHFLGLEFEAEKIRLPRQRLLAIKTKIAALKQSNDGVLSGYIKRLLIWLVSVLTSIGRLGKVDRSHFDNFHIDYSASPKLD